VRREEAGVETGCRNADQGDRRAIVQVEHGVPAAVLTEVVLPSFV
jgi:hypothetical protein